MLTMFPGPVDQVISAGTAGLFWPVIKAFGSHRYFTPFVLSINASAVLDFFSTREVTLCVIHMVCQWKCVMIECNVHAGQWKMLWLLLTAVRRSRLVWSVFNLLPSFSVSSITCCILTTSTNDWRTWERTLSWEFCSCWLMWWDLLSKLNLNLSWSVVLGHFLADSPPLPDLPQCLLTIWVRPPFIGSRVCVSVDVVSHAKLSCNC